MKYRFFDLDGTLADTDRDIREAWKAALADLALECPDFDEKFVAGPPIDEMTKKLFPERFTQELADSIRRLFARHYDSDGFPNTREYPGILDEVKRLKANGDKVYIVTNKRFAGATAMAKKFGWDAIFDGLYAGDMYPGRKMRKVELLAHVLAELKANPADCTMIGDTASDFEAAKKNGVKSIAVKWGYGKAHELAEADLIAEPPFA